jgi:glucose-1-phosphate thymidylyltransferase
VVAQRFAHKLVELLGDESQWGLDMPYDPRQNGLHTELQHWETYIGSCPSSLVLGDSIFYGNGLRKLLSIGMQRTEDGTVLAYHVHDPERYDTAKCDA